MSSRGFDWGPGLLYRGDLRLRLRRATWEWVESGDRMWKVTFEKGFTTGTARHRRFTVAVVKAAWGVYFPPRRNPIEEDEEC